MKIEVKTYEESRREFFKDLARKAEKKLDKCIRAMKQSDYDNPLSENHLALDDALEKKSFYADIVCMLYTENPSMWISVKERLPDTEVLALNLFEGTYGYKEIIIGYVFASEKYESGYAAENEHAILENVTHWMPLPKVTLNRTPTADVVEVRHGMWGFDGMGWTCSECGEYALSNKAKMQVHSVYCPHCGAKMDGERKEE